MSQLADKIRRKVDLAEKIEPDILVVIESALDESDDLAERAMKRLNYSSREKEEAQNVL